MGEQTAVRLTGNDHSREADDVPLGNTSPAGAAKREAFGNCGFRLARHAVDGIKLSRGSKYFMSPADARYLDKNANVAEAKRAVVGFRIVRDEEEE
jgi:hypothetical protein